MSPAGFAFNRETVRFEFVPPGLSLVGQPGRLILDVGSTVGPGILDHHSAGPVGRSTAGLVLQRREFVHWSLPAVGAGTLTVVLHADPDLDAVCAAFLALKLLEMGPGAEPTPAMEALARYALHVDLGNPPDPHVSCSLYGYFYAIDDLFRKKRGRETEPQLTEKILWEQFCLLEFVLSRLAGALDADAAFQYLLAGKLFTPEESRFAAYADWLEDDQQRFLKDLRRPTSQIRWFWVRKAGTDVPVEVQGLVLEDPQSALFKVWARAHQHDGHPLVLLAVHFPKVARSGNPPVSHASLLQSVAPSTPKTPDVQADLAPHGRTVISVNPSSGVDLRGLGDLLDQEESEARERKKRLNLKEIECLRSDPSLEAAARLRKLRDEVAALRRSTRLVRRGYLNEDPWYDARGDLNDHTIVSPPGSGTWLAPGQVLGVLDRYSEQNQNRWLLSASVTVVTLPLFVAPGILPEAVAGALSAPGSGWEPLATEPPARRGFFLPAVFRHFVPSGQHDLKGRTSPGLCRSWCHSASRTGAGLTVNGVLLSPPPGEEAVTFTLYPNGFAHLTFRLALSTSPVDQRLHTLLHVNHALRHLSALSPDRPLALELAVGEPPLVADHLLELARRLLAGVDIVGTSEPSPGGNPILILQAVRESVIVTGACLKEDPHQSKFVLAGPGARTQTVCPGGMGAEEFRRALRLLSSSLPADQPDWSGVLLGEEATQGVDDRGPGLVVTVRGGSALLAEAQASERFLGRLSSVYADLFNLASYLRFSLLRLEDRLSEASSLIRQEEVPSIWNRVRSVPQRFWTLLGGPRTAQQESRRKIRDTRLDVLDFMTHSWFSQVTCDEEGDLLWRRVRKAFELEELYREVVEQTREMDEFLHQEELDRLQRLLGFVAYFGLPLTLFVGVYGMNLVPLQDLDFGSGLFLWGAALTASLMAVLASFWSD